MSKKILFTGASGFIGSHFHKAINNTIITNLDLREPKFKHNADYIKGDIRIKEDVEKAIEASQPEVIVSLAAEHKDFGINREDYFRTNEYGTQVICEAATKYGIKNIVFYSSVAVYGGNTEPSTEQMPPNPNLPYGESKLAGEKVLKKWAAEDASRSVLIIRPSVVYGERNIANMFRLINQIRAGRYFHIGKGDNVKSIVYVKNIVDATLFLMKQMKTGVDIYNYADEPQLTSREIASAITESLSKREPITLPYWAVYTMGIPFDILIKWTGKDFPISTNRVKKFCTETYHKANKVLEAGFKPKYSTIDGLKNMVEWRNKEYKEDGNYFDV
ncbi:MAG: NAD-dependent epimerase/dehydratase family protein [Saprospiraceae bacterium]